MLTSAIILLLAMALAGAGAEAMGTLGFPQHVPLRLNQVRVSLKLRIPFTNANIADEYAGILARRLCCGPTEIQRMRFVLLDETKVTDSQFLE